MPFDPVHKRTEATVKGADGKQFLWPRGSAGNSADGDQRRRGQACRGEAVNEFAGRGFRSLGVARADEEGKWKFVGMLPLFDPPREQAKATMASAGRWA